jgi:hypothetical protein
MARQVFDRKNVTGLWLKDRPYDRFTKILKISDAISKKTRIVRFELAADEYEDHGKMWEYEQKYLEVQVDEWNAEEARKERMPAMAPEQRKDLGSVLREWKASDVRRKETLTPRYHSIQ